MKVFAVLLVVSYVAIAHGLSDEIKEILAAYKKECIAETSVDVEILKKAKENGDFTDDAKLKSFLLCFLKKASFINDAGELQKESIQEKLTEGISEEVAKKVVEACGDKHGSTPEDTAFEFSKCFQEHKPKHE